MSLDRYKPQHRPTVGEMRDKLLVWKHRAESAESALKVIKRAVEAAQRTNAVAAQGYLVDIADAVDDAMSYIDKCNKGNKQ